MFEKVRKPGRAKSITAYIIFGAICLMFVFMGVLPDNFGGVGGGSGAAVVNNNVISIARFQEIYERMRDQQSSRLGDLSGEARREQESRMQFEALEALINNEVLVQSAENSGIRVSDAAVRDRIVNLTWLQEEGRFQRSLYDNYLSYLRINTATFEKRVRNELLAEKMQNLFEKSLRPMTAEKQASGSLRETKVNLEFVRFSQAQLLGSLTVKAPEIETYLAKADNSAKVQKYYEDNKDNYKQEEQVSARHILIKASEKDKGSYEKALAKIKEIEKEVKTGDFGELAAKYSEGPTKTKKGDLGYFGRGRMVPEFEKVAFSLEKGAVSGPVKSSFGYHLIKVENKRAASTKEFKEVENEIARKFIQEESQEKLLNTIKIALKDGDRKAVDSWLKTYKFKWEETGEFDLSRAFPPKIGNKGDKLLNDVLSSASVGALHKEVITVDNQNYIVAVKSLKMPKANSESDEKEDPFFTFTARRRAQEALGNWQEEVRKSAKISRNRSLFATPASAKN